jgi:acetyl esterase/lipase
VAVADAELLAETRAFNAQLEALLAEAPRVYEIPIEESRAGRRDGRGPFPPPVYLPQARDLTIPSRGGDLRLRILAPESESTGVYLHIHGGGFAVGAADLQDVPLWQLVEATGLCAVSVDYRLAPEHPYPAGPDDCEDAALWLLEHGLEELGAPNRLAIGGESAGGHLAALTLIRLRDRHGIRDAFRAANLVFGVFDLSGTPSRRRWGNRELVLSAPTMNWFEDAFLPGFDVEQRRDPDVSPLYADLSGLPPALFTVGTLDALLDDTLFMHARWQVAGSPAELRVYEEGVHGFVAFPIGIARAANDEIHAFLRRAVVD